MINLVFFCGFGLGLGSLSAPVGAGGSGGIFCASSFKLKHTKKGDALS